MVGIFLGGSLVTAKCLLRIFITALAICIAVAQVIPGNGIAGVFLGGSLVTVKCLLRIFITALAIRIAVA